MIPAEIIAANLAALPHPDGTPRQLAGFSTQLLPDALQEQIGKTAKDIGEAIINLLEINGYKVVTEAELGQPTQTSDSSIPVANVHCNLCETKLMALAMNNPSKVMVHARLLIEGLAARKPECPHDPV